MGSKMNKLQQEIKSFHENIKPTLEKVLEQYEQRTPQNIYNNIIKPCKRLIQKCSFKSVSDIMRLCSLVYWLYIYDHKELALEICEYTHGVDFEIEYQMMCIGYPDIYGLEIRLARELLGENRKGNIPSKLLDYYLLKRVKKHIRFPQILGEEEITASRSPFPNIELLHALYNMIGKGETGLYIDLNKNWDKIENTIIEYINYLKNAS